MRNKVVFLPLGVCLILALAGCGLVASSSSQSTGGAKPSGQSAGLVSAGSQLFVYIEPSDKGCFSDGNAAISAGDVVSLVLADPQLNPRTELPLATSSLYAREGGCGLGAEFTLNANPTKSSGVVIDTTSGAVVGNIELTTNGNTDIYFSTNANGNN